MGIKTEDMVKNLPGKEMAADVDWLGILDAFDPKKLEQRYLNECARRNPYETCYYWDTPYSPVSERLKFAEFCVKSYRSELEKCAERIKKEGVTPSLYKKARAELIRNIGIKGAEEYIRQEYERLGEAGRQKQAEEYKRWEKENEEEYERRKREDEEALRTGNDYYSEPELASVHEKIVRIRKGLKSSNGKPLVQRDFAKLLEYPINKYAEAEKTDRYGRGEVESEVEDELLHKLVMIAHANPYWLFDPYCEAYYAEDDMYASAVLMGGAPCVYATVDVILRWIKEGKPELTCWEDGVCD